MMLIHRLVLIPFLPLLAASGALCVAPPCMPLKEYARKCQARYTYSFYFGDKKVGRIVEESRLGRRDGRDVLVKTTEMHLDVERDGETTKKTDKTIDRYALTGEGALVGSERRTTEDGKETILRAQRQGKRVRLTARQDGRARERVVGLPRHTLAEERRFEAWLAGARKGDRFVRWYVQWDRDSPDVKETCIYRERRTAVLNGRRVPVHAVVLARDDMRLVGEVLGNGVLYRGQVEGTDMAFRLEKAARPGRPGGGKGEEQGEGRRQPQGP
jgi:hypothetical protein